MTTEKRLKKIEERLEKIELKLIEIEMGKTEFDRLVKAARVKYLAKRMKKLLLSGRLTRDGKLIPSGGQGKLLK